MIRRMIVQDTEQIQILDRKINNTSFSRRKEGIESYIRKSNNASLVYEIDNRIVGFIFNHIWGEFAWFGFFGVDPEYRGSGIGKKLLQETIGLLKEEYHAKNIGLGTMPENVYNVGFYMSMGFKPLTLSVGLIKNLSEFDFLGECKKYNVLFADIENDHRYFELKQNVQKLSDKISKGLDLSSQLEMVRRGEFGFVLELRIQNEFKGFAICHTKNIREMDTECIEIKQLCIDDTVEQIDGLKAILDQCVLYGRKKGYKQLYIDCNTVHREVCTYLLSIEKFKVVKTQLSLIMGNEKYLEEYKGMFLCRWAG